MLAASKVKMSGSRAKQRQGKDKMRAARVYLFLLIRRKRVLHVQFVFLLITNEPSEGREEIRAPLKAPAWEAIRAKTLGWRGGSRIEPRKTRL